MAGISGVELPLGYTPRPRDSFVFHALTHGLVSIPEVRVRPVINDLADLGQAVMAGRLLASKVSVLTFGRVRQRFIGLRAGATFSRDAGPLVVGRDSDVALETATVAVDSADSTATLLLRLLVPHRVRVKEVGTSATIEAVVSGQCEAAVVTGVELSHYPDHSLPTLDDLGAAWQRQTGLPLPYDVVVVRRDIGPALAMRLDRGIRDSIAYARAHPEDSAEHVRKQARELDDAIRFELDTYVSDLTEELDEEGLAAVRELFARAGARGLVPRSEHSPFVPAQDV